MGPSGRFTHVMDYIGYMMSIMQGLKRSFLLGIVVYETMCGHCVYWDRLYTGVVFG